MDTKEKIEAYLKANGPATVAQVAEALALNANTVWHHVPRMQRQNRLHVRSAGRRRLLAAGPPSEEPLPAPLLLDEDLRMLLEWLRRRPGVRGREVVQEFQRNGWSRRTTHRRLRRLESDGLLVRRKDGREHVITAT